MNDKEKIIAKINHSRKGTIFLPESFLPIDPRHASNTMSALVKEGKLVRVVNGIYVRPKMTRFGPLMPDSYQIAQAVAKRDAAKILPCGAAAENYLGLSTQVPMKTAYLTSGSSRRLKIGENRYITLIHASPSAFAYKGKVMPILVLALKSIGKDNIDDETRQDVAGILYKYPETETWQHDIAHAPNWIRRIITETKRRFYEMDQGKRRRNSENCTDCRDSEKH